MKAGVERGRAWLTKQLFGGSETVLTVDGEAGSRWACASPGKALHTSLTGVHLAATTPLVLQTH